jgi:predicted secreted protein
MRGFILSLLFVGLVAGEEIKITGKDGESTIKVKNGDTIVVELICNPSTGYAWECSKSDLLKEVEKPRTLPIKDLEFPGAEGKTGKPELKIFKYKAEGTGETTFEFKYRGPGKPAKVTKTFSVKLVIEEPLKTDVKKIPHKAWIGELTVGRAQVGGETTGIVLTIDKVRYQLNIRADKNLRELVRLLQNGQVCVIGPCYEIPTVEGKSKKVIEVNRLYGIQSVGLVEVVVQFSKEFEEGDIPVVLDRENVFVHKVERIKKNIFLVHAEKDGNTIEKIRKSPHVKTAELNSEIKK